LGINDVHAFSDATTSMPYYWHIPETKKCHDRDTLSKFQSFHKEKELVGASMSL
jgi:hypothetical protein